MKNKKTGGRAPYGFTWYDSELVHIPEEVPVYTELFDLYLLHQRKRTVARLLNEKGYRTRAGKKFAYTSVDRMLKNPIAKGVHRTSYTEKSTGEHKWVERPVPAVISEETWDQAQQILESATSQTRIPAQDIFVGRVYCECNEAMEILSKSTNYSCHRCKTEIPIEDVHVIFDHSLKDIPFPDRETLEQYGETDTLDTEPAVFAKISKLTNDIEKLFELHSSEAITTDVFKARHSKLNTQLSELNDTLAAYKEKPVQTYDCLLDFWNASNKKTKHVLLDTILYRITLESNVASISLYPLFNFAQHGTETPSNSANLEKGTNT